VDHLRTHSKNNRVIR